MSAVVVGDIGVKAAGLAYALATLTAFLVVGSVSVIEPVAVGVDVRRIIPAFTLGFCLALPGFLLFLIGKEHEGSL